MRAGLALSSGPGASGQAGEGRDTPESHHTGGGRGGPQDVPPHLPDGPGADVVARPARFGGGGVMGFLLSEQDINQVIDDLSEGLGVEDIAAQRGIRVQSVRKLVADLRAAGLLADVLAGDGT